MRQRILVVQQQYREGALAKGDALCTGYDQLCGPQRVGKMLSWKVGIKTDFQVSVGKSAKYLHRWLDADEYQGYLNTYFDGNVEKAWTSVMYMCDLFEQTAEFVGQKLGYVYNTAEGKAARGFLERVRKLPEDAESV